MKKKDDVDVTIKLKIEKDRDGKQKVKETKDQIDGISESLKNLESAAVFTGVNVAVQRIQQLGFSWLDAAGKMQEYQAQLRTVLKDHDKAKEKLAQAVEKAPKTPFNVEEISNATAIIEVYGQTSEKWFTRTGNLAAGMTKDLKKTSLIVSKALTGSLEGYESLRNEYGISTAKLTKYGAVMAKTGGISVQTSEDLAKAQEALAKLIDTEFAGAMERLAKTWKGATSNWQDAITNLKVSLGNELLPTFVQITQSATAVINSINSMPRYFKWLVASSGALAVGLSSIISAGVGIIRVLPMVKSYFAIVRAEMTATTIASNSLGTALSVTTGVLAVAAIGMQMYIKYLEEKNEKDERAVKKSESAMQSLRDVTRKYAGKSSEDLRMMGVTAKDLEEDIRNMNDEADKAYKKGDRAQGNFYKKGVKQAQDMLKLLKDLEGEYKSLAIVINDLNISYDLMKKADVFGSSKEEADFLAEKLDYIIKRLKETSNEDYGLKLNIDTSDIESVRSGLNELNDLIIAMENKKKIFNTALSKPLLAGIDKELEHLKSARDAFQLLYDSRKAQQSDAIDEAKRHFSEQQELNDMSLSDEYDYWKKFIETNDLAEKQLKEIKHRMAVVKVKMAKESRKDVADALKDEVDTIDALTNNQVEAYNRVIVKIQDLIKTRRLSEKDGRSLLRNVKKKRDDSEVEYLKEKYDDIERVQGETLRNLSDAEEHSYKERLNHIDSYMRYWENELQKQPRLRKEINDQIVALEKEKAEIQRDILKVNKDAEKELRNLRKESIDYDLDKLVEKLEKGEDVEKKFLEKFKERQKIELQTIDEIKRKMENQGIERQNIEETISLMKQKAHRDELQAIDEVIDKLKKKKKEEKEDRGPIQGIEGLVQHQAGLFERDKEKQENKKAIARLEEEKKRIKDNLRRIDLDIKNKQISMGLTTDEIKKSNFQSQIEKLQGQRAKIQTLNTPKTFDAPVQLFSESVHLFKSIIQDMKDVMSNGLTVPSVQHQAIVAAGTGAGSAAGVNVNININGGGQAGQVQTGTNQGVTAKVKRTDQGFGIDIGGISQALTNFTMPDVRPIGRGKYINGGQ